MSSKPKLYAEPAATTCRPVLLFLADAKMPIEVVHVDLFQGGHRSPDFTRLNPNQAVPVLDDDGFLLNECSAILKYLADKVGSPAYPADLQARARVNATMDWFNTGLMRTLCYGLVYCRILPEYTLPEPALSQYIAFSQPRAEKNLTVLDGMIGSNRYVCGNDITLADYLGVAMITLAELVDFDFSRWPNITRWLATMKARPTFDEVHCAFYGWLSALRAQQQLRA